MLFDLPFEKTMQVRYRKDGSLYKSMNLPLNIKNALAARLKILAGLNITERRVPQDGRIQIRVGRNKSVDFRVFTLPLLHSEGIVLHILNKGYGCLLSGRGHRRWRSATESDDSRASRI